MEKFYSKQIPLFDIKSPHSFFCDIRIYIAHYIILEYKAN